MVGNLPAPTAADLLTPLNLAEYASGGMYRRARHLQVIEHEVMATLLGDWDVCVIQAPPRHGKSEYSSRWLPAWHHCVYPRLPSIITSYAVDLARNHSRWVRDRVHELAPIYGHGGVSQHVASAGDWQMQDSPYGMKAAGVGGGITGRGAHLFLIDDPLKNAEQAISEGVRESQWEWFQTTAFTRIEPGGKLIVLGTRWHEEDLLGRILSTATTDMGLRLREIRLPALAEPSEHGADPLGRQTDEPLWPERWSFDALDRVRRTLEPYWWNALYQQRLGSYGRNEWPTEYFYGVLANDDEWPETFALSATALDPSKGKNAKSGDYSAIIYVGFKDGYLWVDADLERRPVPKMVADLVAWNMDRRPTVTGIEGVAFQELLAESYIQAQQEAGDYRDEPVLIDNTVNKQLRIARIGFWLRLHRIKIRRSPGGTMLLDQLKNFPNAAHDDGPDGLEMAIRLLLQLSDDLQAVANVGSVGTSSLTV